MGFLVLNFTFLVPVSRDLSVSCLYGDFVCGACKCVFFSSYFPLLPHQQTSYLETKLLRGECVCVSCDELRTCLGYISFILPTGSTRQCLSTKWVMRINECCLHEQFCNIRVAIRVDTMQIWHSSTLHFVQSHRETECVSLSTIWFGIFFWVADDANKWLVFFPSCQSHMCVVLSSHCDAT